MDEVARTLDTPTLRKARGAFFTPQPIGGILKMEPREAAGLPVPRVDILLKAWELLLPEREQMDRDLAAGEWEQVAAQVEAHRRRLGTGRARPA